MVTKEDSVDLENLLVHAVQLGQLILFLWLYHVLTFELKVRDKQIADLQDAVRGETTSTLTEYEEMKQEREALFDERISRMKEELAVEQEFRFTPPAQEFHPDVKNIEPRTSDVNVNREEEIAE